MSKFRSFRVGNMPTRCDEIRLGWGKKSTRIDPDREPIMRFESLPAHHTRDIRIADVFRYIEPRFEP